MVAWKEEYRIGIEKIDQQHRKLFEIAGRAYDILKDPFSLDKYDQIVEIIEELKDYTIYHFNSEEEYMQSIGYKRFFSHKVQHEEFIDKIRSVDLTKIDYDQDKYLVDLLDFVLGWIDGHILGTDKLIVEP
ncbi:MAG TPA: hemerythrin family protein [Clostridia bacterium]|nr:hemerythrin family protein [Clostridia bacterium]